MGVPYSGRGRAETQGIAGNFLNMLPIRVKLDKKNIDMIVANNLKVEGAGFGTDTNVVTIITRERNLELEKMTKEEVADRLLDEILAVSADK